MAARGMLQNPAMFAGHDQTPLQCVKDWVRFQQCRLGLRLTFEQTVNAQNFCFSKIHPRMI